MRLLLRTIAILLVSGAATEVRAQAPAPDAAAVAPAPAAQPSTASPDSSGFWNRGESHWIAAGSIGANSGRNLVSTGVNFGGQVGYLYHGVFGGEFLADFAPRFDRGNVFFAQSPNVNAYMANALGAWPIGHDGMFQPYVSGGAGWIHMRSQIFNIATFASSGINSVSSMHGAGDVGGGVMWFAGRVGARIDVRYFRAFNSAFTPGDGASAAEIFSGNLLPGLDFWRTNIGIAFRW